MKVLTLECISKWMMIKLIREYKRYAIMMPTVFLIRITKILFAPWPLILKFNQYLRIWIRYQAITTAQREESYCPSQVYLEPKWFLELKGFSFQLFLCRKQLTPSSSIFDSLILIQRKQIGLPHQMRTLSIPLCMENISFLFV